MFLPRRILHCRVCGAAAEYRIPPDDNRERATCTACGEIHYENPINVVGTLPVWGDQVLLCRRNIEPRYGFWTLPAGFLELGESTAEGALRETDEEAGARIELQGLYTVLNVVRVGQVHLYYLYREMKHANSKPHINSFGLINAKWNFTHSNPHKDCFHVPRRNSTSAHDRE